MGCSNSKPEMRLPRNPIEALQFQEMQGEYYKYLKKKEQKQVKALHRMAKIQMRKKAKKTKNSKKKKEEKENVEADNSKENWPSERNYEEEHNLQIESTIQKQLESDLCAFVLDQVAFTMEFFSNYENELTSILAEFLDKENECNKNLEEHSVLLANPLDAAMAKWVRFRPTHGPDKYQSQLIQTPVIYVVFENIDIIRPNEANYDSITPLCKVVLETDSYRTTPCKEHYIEVLREIKWKGYVRLKMRESNKSKASNKIYGTENPQPTEQPIYSTNAISSTSSGYGSESDYDYVYITLLNSHQPLSKLKMANQPKGNHLSTKVLPDSCISRLSNYIDPKVFEENDDDDEMESDDDASDVEKRKAKKSKAFQDYETMQAIRRFKLDQERQRKLLHQRYLNSKEFLCYFGELLRQKLAKQLPIKKGDLENATYRCASIFTKDYEFTPALYVPHNAQSWPECALQFRVRERPVKTHPRTGEQVQWPTNAMMKQIETFGYHVIPMGYAPKKRRNPFREIEWRIVFPKAERYLERHLTHTQVKVLMIMKALVKTFIEPVEKDRSLLFAMDFLRTHLFWECERDFTAWPEELLGDVFVRFLESFLYRLRHKRLRDYFIEERNLFECIPESSLMSVYTILADVAGNPLMHLMVAFRNLEINEEFFPKLNFKNVFFNLAFDNIVHLKELSKNSHVLVENESNESEVESSLDMGPVGLVGREQHNVRTTGKLRKRTCQLKLEIEKNLEEQKEHSLSVETIDVEFLFSNELSTEYDECVNKGVESLRRTNLLEMLIEHYMAMVRKSAKFSNIELAQAWLKQAGRLTKFYNDFGCDLYAKDYENSILTIGSMIGELKDDDEFSLDSIPSLPKRIEQAKQRRKINKLAESDAYEEVIPMDDNLPSIQSAMLAWKKKLNPKQQSRESSPESVRSTNVQEVVVEVYSREEKKENIELDRSSDRKAQKKSSKNKRDHRAHSPVDFFREAFEGNKKSEKESELTKHETTKKSVLFQKSVSKTGERVEKRQMNRQMQVGNENGHVNVAYEGSTSDEYRTDTEGESSMYSATEFSETEIYGETSFIESRVEEKVSVVTENTRKVAQNQKNNYSCSETETDDEDIENRKTTNKSTTSVKKSREENGPQEVIQIETENDSDNDANQPRYSFKCLENISVSAILESKEYQEEEKVPFKGEHRDLLNISYDIPREPSEENMLDLIKLDEMELERRNSKRSSKAKRRAKNNRRKRRKQYLKSKIITDTESVATTHQDEPKDDECVIEIDSNELKDIENGEESAEKSMFSKYINRETILKTFPMISAEMIDTVTESKQKIKEKIKKTSNRETITQVRDILKEKTIKLKGALLQSSET